ncbi:MAG: DinB family protein [Bacteroidota bacterium]
MNEKLAKAYKKIEQQRLGIMAELAAYSHETINTPPAPGKWSIAQILTHLILTEQGSLGYWSKKLQAPEKIPPVGFSAKVKYWLFTTYYKLGLTFIKFKAPTFSSQVPAETPLNELDANWKKLRQQLKKVAEETPIEVLNKGMLRHLIVGRIDMGRVIGFYHTHVNHHHKQIRNILKKAQPEADRQPANEKVNN